MEAKGWILLLYSLPRGRGTARVGIWRQFKKSGALSPKTSAYLLPNRPELIERFQWLAQQVRDAGGEATLAHVSEMEGLTNNEIIRQFNEARAQDYSELLALLHGFMARHRKKVDETFAPELEKLRRQFEDIRRMDFLECSRGQNASRMLEQAAALATKKDPVPKHVVLSIRRYAGKTWLTRPCLHIDRVGTAWLITHFIDAKARSVFADDPRKHPEAIPYDMTGVEFTHHGEDCTVETFIKRPGLDDFALRRIGEMVHDVDLEDGKFQTTEATGTDRVLKGWGNLGLPDEEIMARGFQCFDALYEFFKGRRS